MLKNNEVPHESSLMETIDAVNGLYAREALDSMKNIYVRTLLLDAPEQDARTMGQVVGLANSTREAQPHMRGDAPFSRLLGVFALEGAEKVIENADKVADFHLRHSALTLDGDHDNVFSRLMHGSEIAVIGTEVAANQIVRAIAGARLNRQYGQHATGLNNMGRSQGGSANGLKGYQLAASARVAYDGSLYGKPLRIGGLVH